MATSLTAEEIKEYTFPQYVKIEDGSAVDLGPLVDKEDTLIIHAYRKRTKVLADNLKWDSSKKDYVQFGPKVEIPKDYPGSSL